MAITLPANDQSGAVVNPSARHPQPEQHPEKLFENARHNRIVIGADAEARLNMLQCELPGIVGTFHAVHIFSSAANLEPITRSFSGLMGVTVHSVDEHGLDNKLSEILTIIDDESRGAGMQSRLIVIEDPELFTSATTLNSATFNELLANSRHHALDCLHFAPCDVKLGPDVRTNFDLVLILPTADDLSGSVYATDEPEEDDEGVVVEDLRSDSRRNFDNWAGIFPNHGVYQTIMRNINEDGGMGMLINNRSRSEYISHRVLKYTLGSDIGSISRVGVFVDDEPSDDSSDSDLSDN
jgi:hypothetical protein